MSSYGISSTVTLKLPPKAFTNLKQKTIFLVAELGNDLLSVIVFAPEAGLYSLSEGTEDI